MLMPWNDSLYSLRRFQNISSFPAGHTFVFGQAQIFNRKRSRSKIRVRFSSPDRFFAENPCLAWFGQKQKCGRREMQSCPGRSQRVEQVTRRRQHPPNPFVGCKSTEKGPKGSLKYSLNGSPKSWPQYRFFPG